MLGKLWFTQNMEIPSRVNVDYRKNYIFRWLCHYMGISPVILNFWPTVVSTHCLCAFRRWLLHDFPEVAKAWGVDTKS
jgi:hypothetical protein